MLTHEVKNEIKAHALSNSSKECCGFIVLIGSQLKVIRGRNESEKPQNTFSISPKDYLRASMAGKIVGCYHSHCAGHNVFSEFDKLNSENHKINFVLYSIKQDEFLVYQPLGKYNRYVGREFQIGVNDCFSLIRDYFKNEFGIEIADYSRSEGWMSNSPYFFDTEYEKEGFVKISDGFSELTQSGDVCLIKPSYEFKHAAHAVIYLGNDTILHHRRLLGSTIERYSDAYKRRTMMVVRHNKLI